jgi:hypothetical protein
MCKKIHCNKYTVALDTAGNAPGILTTAVTSITALKQQTSCNWFNVKVL